MLYYALEVPRIIPDSLYYISYYVLILGCLHCPQPKRRVCLLLSLCMHDDRIRIPGKFHRFLQNICIWQRYGIYSSSDDYGCIRLLGVIFRLLQINFKKFQPGLWSITTLELKYQFLCIVFSITFQVFSVTSYEHV